MDIKQIIEMLSTRFEGVNAAVFEGIAKKLAKTVTDEASLKEAVEGVTFQQVIDSYTENRVSQAQKTAVANYEKKFGLKDGKPSQQDDTPPAPPTPPVDDETPAWAKSLIKQVSDQNAIIAALQSEKTISSRQARMAEALSKLPDNVKARYEKDFARLNFKDEDDFNSWLEEAQTDFGNIGSEFNNKGTQFQPPFGGSQQLPGNATEEQKALAKSVVANLVKH